MSVWNKVTPLGERRRADMVSSADAPPRPVIPDVLELLGDSVLRPPGLRHLVTAMGEVLNPPAKAVSPSKGGRGISGPAIRCADLWNLRRVRAPAQYLLREAGVE